MINRYNDVDVLLSIAMALLFYIAGMIYVLSIKDKDTKLMAKIFSLAFFLRFIVLYGIYYYLTSIGGDGYVIMDDRNYDLTGRQIAYELSKGFAGFKEYGTGWANIGYFNFTGFLYHYLEFDTLTMRMLNVFLSSLTAILAFMIIKKIFDDQRAKIVGYTIAVLPNLVFWSTQQLKDTAIIFCSMVLIYIMVCKFREKLSFFSIIMYALFLFFLWHLRKNFCFPFIAVSALWLVLRYTKLGIVFKDRKKFKFLKVFVLTGAGMVMLLVLAFTGTGVDFTDSMSNFNDMNKQIAESPGAGAAVGFSRYLRVVSPYDIYKLPAAMAFTAIVPLPSFHSLGIPNMAGSALYSIVNISLILMMPFVLLGFFLFKSEKLEFTDELLLKWLPLLTLMGLSVIYMGVLRYKSMLLVYFIIWASMAIHERKKYKTKIILIYLASFFSVALVIPIASIFR